jgi:hypothetical protein
MTSTPGEDTYSKDEHMEVVRTRRWWRSMLDGLRGYACSRPKKLIALVATLIVASIVVSSFVISFALRHGYPSEDTPLTLVENGIMWTADHGNDSLLCSNYTWLTIRISDGVRPIDGVYNVLWYLGDTPLSLGLTNYCVVSNQTLCGLTLSLNITDVAGNGLFERGDYFLITVLNGASFAEQVTYKVSILFNNPIWFYHRDISFAIDGGTFYSWDSTPYQLVM